MLAGMNSIVLLYTLIELKGFGFVTIIIKQNN